ncbi:hypothetical protein THRCLA_07934 [Thraustotheca clavata]|uniref:tRNA-dihydrouridine(16/17) synthase [NAD(P)(+)] n=1 Tax=Thraustotheca clavata TaxID=74557 RepID=A0A1V9ZBL2_9STRA|nr:hypothetical protein THRCLA_07934 [Thraustotheca clavata]
MVDAAWKWYREVVNEPRYVCAPMVRQSELAFRLLTREFGCDLTYSPMLPAIELVNAAKCAKPNTDISLDFFDIDSKDRPLIVQICGNDPDLLAQAVQLVQHRCDGVDLNLGCPQRCACNGGFGAFLLEKPDLIFKLVQAMVAVATVPITCKIRILPNEEDTIALAQKIEEAGCSMLTVHGRLREQRHHEGKCNWDVIRKVREAISIPMIANGGIRTLDEAEACLAYTGCQAVMSGTGLLDNPAMFSSMEISIYDTALRYLEIVRQMPRTLYATAARDHIISMFRSMCTEDDKDLYSVMGHHDVLLPDQLEACVAHLAKRQSKIINTQFGDDLPTLRQIRYNKLKSNNPKDFDSNDEEYSFGFSWLDEE